MYRNLCKKFAATAVMLSAFGLSLLKFAPASAQSKTPHVFVGGVSGIQSLTNPANSTRFRAGGGGLYLHHSGWTRLSMAEKDAVQKAFAGRDYAVEIGYNTASPAAWISSYVKNYLGRGIHPVFITANAFSSARLPTPDQWNSWIAGFRQAGVDARTKILPTFEYANFRRNMESLGQNRVSQRADFQAMITASRGIVLDTPSQYFFGREEAYREWVLDAIQWTHLHGFQVVVIVSPRNAGTQYDEQTALYVDYLNQHHALPDIFSVENYSMLDPTIYPNIVGNEDVPHQQLGCALLMQTIWLPKIMRRETNTIQK